MIRQYRFLRPVEAFLLTQRRVLGPFGIKGGAAGAKGKNVRVTAAGERVAMPGVTSFAVEAGLWHSTLRVFPEAR